MSMSQYVRVACPPFSHDHQPFRSCRRTDHGSWFIIKDHDHLNLDHVPMTWGMAIRSKGQSHPLIRALVPGVHDPLTGVWPYVPMVSGSMIPPVKGV